MRIVVGWAASPPTRSTNGCVFAHAMFANDVAPTIGTVMHHDEFCAGWTRGRETRPPYGVKS